MACVGQQQDRADRAAIWLARAMRARVRIATWTNTEGSQENLPINGVNWYEAYAFCIWDGGFLPSEAEWVYAAAGGSLAAGVPVGQHDAGDDVPRNWAVEIAIYDCDYPGWLDNLHGREEHRSGGLCVAGGWGLGPAWTWSARSGSGA